MNNNKDKLEERRKYFIDNGIEIHKLHSIHISEVINLLKNHFDEHGDIELFATNFEFGNIIRLKKDDFVLMEEQISSGSVYGAYNYPLRLQIV
ncbi:MAG: hypothetical protein GY861_22295 [bacterium]|nr:hypothetical protein [bacterium]